jgi:hypothetical protein
MRFSWRSDTWVPAPDPVLSRRLFLGGLAAAIAAPMVVRSGVLMPVRSPIVPATPKLLAPAAAFWIEASPDGENWVKVSRVVSHGVPDMSRVGNHIGAWRRVAVERGWRIYYKSSVAA